ncbi:MAG: hypothetical protein MSC31_10860 [Solirubrobacteraceae bacterium MAG38_C4-C5]|nr:hypothetical protein [Candidatus Siliceabacter maunaloa]
MTVADDLAALAAAARDRVALLAQLVAERDEQARRRRVAFTKAVVARRGLGRRPGRLS